MSLLRSAVVCAVALVGMSQRAEANNLVQNPDFDTDLAGWEAVSANYGTVIFNNSDGSPAAGSAQFNAGAGGEWAFLQQCVSPAGPPPWSFGARIRIVSSYGPIVTAYVGARFFESADCTLSPTSPSPVISAAAGPNVSGIEGTFIQYSGYVASNPLSGASPVQSVLVTVGASASIYSAIIANGDHVYFGPPDPALPVTLQFFDVR